jgi:hypothetical protein
MDIRFVSSLTLEDEERLAPVLLKFIGAVLDALPLAYTLQIETGLGTEIRRRRDEPVKVVPAPLQSD